VGWGKKKTNHHERGKPIQGEKTERGTGKEGKRQMYARIWKRGENPEGAQKTDVGDSELRGGNGHSRGGEECRKGPKGRGFEAGKIEYEECNGEKHRPEKDHEHPNDKRDLTTFRS